MTGPRMEPLTDRELDALLSRASIPAPSTDFADRIVVEATRADRVPALPAPLPGRAKRPRWTRRSMVVGIIALNLFAASAIAAAFHGGEGFKRLSALSSHVIHSITAAIVPHRAEHRAVAHTRTAPAMHVEPRPAPRFVAPPRPVVRMASMRPIARMPALDRPRWETREMRHAGVARTERRQQKTMLLRDRKLGRHLRNGPRKELFDRRGDRERRLGATPRPVDRGQRFGRDPGVRRNTDAQRSRDRLDQHPGDVAPNGARQSAGNPDRYEPGRFAPDRGGFGRMAPGQQGRRGWGNGWRQRRALGPRRGFDRRGPRRWR